MMPKLAKATLAVTMALAMTAGCQTADVEKPIVPDTAVPIVSSLNEFLNEWNQAADARQPAWRIDNLPPVTVAPAFEHKVATDLDLFGYLNPATKSVVLVSLFAVRSQARSSETLRDAVSNLVLATSPAEQADVTAILDGLQLDSLPSDTTGQVTEAVKMDRVFRLQRYPAVVVITVSANEPWDFLDTDHHHDDHNHP